jgi:PPOX class probable F420-dependent enzyme
VRRLVFFLLLLPIAYCLMPLVRLTPQASRLIRSARIAHLATADANGQPHVIPICFAFDGSHFYSPIDEKPKRAAPSKLKRVRNIKANPQVALVIDRYVEDWKKLAYILIFGRARVLSRGHRHGEAVRLLRQKYPQYRRMAIDQRPMIAITPKRIITWAVL